MSVVREWMQKAIEVAELQHRHQEGRIEALKDEIAVLRDLLGNVLDDIEENWASHRLCEANECSIQQARALLGRAAPAEETETHREGN